MEQPKYHEIISPIREIVHGLGEKVCNWVIGDAFNNFMQGVSEESAIRTVQTFSYDDMGDYHDPDVRTVPDVAGRDL